MKMGIIVFQMNNNNISKKTKYFAKQNNSILIKVYKIINMKK